MLAVTEIIHLVCRHAKLKALLTGISFQSVNQAEAVVTNQTKEFCTAHWYVNCSLNSVDNITYCLYLFIQPEMHSIQKKTLFKYSNYYVVLFRHQAVCSSTIM